MNAPPSVFLTVEGGDLLGSRNTLHEGGEFFEADSSRADAHERPLYNLRHHVHHSLDPERAGRRRLLELPPGLHGPGARGVERQPRRALRAAAAEGEGQMTVIMDETIQAFLGDAEERGTIEESELEALAVEHDLEEDELAALRSELEAREVDVAAPVSAP